MDGGSTTSYATRNFPRSQKLKDTCDMCSASKIRCTKEKPICGRCDKLGYPCFYSPARRIGRPHTSRKATPQNKSRVVAEPYLSERRSMSGQSDDGGIEPESNGSFTETHISLEHDIREMRAIGPQGSENDFNSDSVMVGFHSPAMSLSGQIDCPQTDLYTLNKKSLDTTPGGDVEEHDIFNFDDLVYRENSIEGDGLYYQEIPSDDSSGSHVPSNYNYSCSSTSSKADHNPGMDNHFLPKMLACGEDSTSNNAEYDCATGAMNMLQHLSSMTSMKRLSGAMGPVEEIDALLGTVSVAIKRVSTILVCPCSQKTDVGLLAAAVCGAILEIYGAIFRNPTTDSEVCAGTHQDVPNEKIQVLAELPKVAGLVMQFMTRYSNGQDVEEYSTNVLPELAASLKYKLKYMTNEATNWLAQV